MKTLLLLLTIFIALPIKSQVLIEDQVFISAMKQSFPLTYQTIDSMARINKYIMIDSTINSEILSQCRAFIIITHITANPQFYCDVSADVFISFYIQAIKENSKSIIRDCMKTNGYDARNACLNPDWWKVLNSLAKQIGDYHLAQIKRTIFV